MKARIESRFATMQLAVWFYTHGPDGAVVYDADGSVQERLAVGEDAGEPSLVISEDALKALISQAGDHLPPSSASDRHLADAISVRDRLLSMVEANAAGPPIAGEEAR